MRHYSYPDHYRFKINRIKALKKSKGKCEVCGKTAIHVHHIDESNDNHETKNLMPVCSRCHKALHNTGSNSTSKYKRLLGYSLKEITNMAGGTPSCYSMMLRQEGGLEKVQSIIENYKKKGGKK